MPQAWLYKERERKSRERSPLQSCWGISQRPMKDPAGSGAEDWSIHDALLRTLLAWGLCYWGRSRAKLVSSGPSAKATVQWGQSSETLRFQVRSQTPGEKKTPSGELQGQNCFHHKTIVALCLFVCLFVCFLPPAMLTFAQGEQEPRQIKMLVPLFKSKTCLQTLGAGIAFSTTTPPV